MKLSSYARRCIGVLGSVMAGGLLLASGQALGLTAAGQPITNIATVTYEDSLGNTFDADSNPAVVTVAEVYAATIEQDRSREGAPGQTVYFQHFLENTGNATDTYTISTFLDDDANGTSDSAGDDSDYFVFLDTNGNGEPNSGEPIVVDPANANGTVVLNAGETANLLVAFPIPGGASDGDTFGVTILAESTNTTVDDLTSGDGADALDGTNNDTATARTGAVLTLVKNATFEDGGTPNDPNDDAVVYELRVTNNGGTAATNVDIIDAIPTDTTFDSIVSIAGLSAANGDSQMTSAAGGTPTLQAIGTGSAGAFDIDETDVGLDGAGAAESLDINVDGDTADTAITAIYFRDASLAPNVTVSVTYRVTIDTGLNAGETIDNIFIADDVDSPQVTVNVPQAFAVTAEDNGGNGGNNGVNDGGDDDNTDNGEAFVDAVADGDTVLFTNIITNNGNGPDVFELSILNDAGAGASAAGCSAFPAGTSFSFYNAGNTSALTNSNGQFGVDTGELARNESLTITVRAELPDGFSGAGDFCATTTARSFGAGTTSPVQDTKVERLGAIIAPTLDLANADYDTGSTTLPQEVSATVTSPAAAASSSETDGFNDDGTVDAHPSSGVTTFAEIAAGTVQDFELFIANEGASSDSYDLTAANVPGGWSVQFIERGVDTDGDGTLDVTTNAGAVTTTTLSLIPAGAVYQYTARVTTSSVQSESLADAPAAGSNTDANGDGDVDYVLTFTATSTTNAASTDSKLDAIDIADNPAVEVTPDQADQVQPGGSVDYSNTVTNTGNVPLQVTLTAVHSIAGFDDTTLIDTDGDGVGDTEIENLTDGSTITVDDGAGNDQTIEVSIVGGNPVFTLEPGEVIPLDITVQAPADAAQGDEDFFVITAEDATEGAVDSATDRTEVVTVQVRLDKTVAVDTACGCDPNALTFPAIAGSGATAAAADVEPGQCVVWQLTATNQSTQDALNVVINDAVTDFTTLEQPNPGTDDGLYYCQGASCSPAAVTAAADADEGTVTGTDVAFSVGTLSPGDAATGSFCVRVD